MAYLLIYCIRTQIVSTSFNNNYTTQYEGLKNLKQNIMKKLIAVGVLIFYSFVFIAQTKTETLALIRSGEGGEKFFKVMVDIDLKTNDSSFYMIFHDQRYESLKTISLLPLENINKLNSLFKVMEKAIVDTDDIKYDWGDNNTIWHAVMYTKKTFAVLLIKDGSYTMISQRQIDKAREYLGLI